MKNQNIDALKKIKHEDFDREVSPHTDAIYKYALKLSGNEEDADDLFQDTMLKAFRYFHNFEQGTNCKAWLFSIMRNTFINEYRRQMKEPLKVDYDDVQNFYDNIKETEVAFQHIVEDSFSTVMSDEITDALSELPPDSQTILILSDIEGYNYDEVAEFMSCPVGTVRSRLHRARKMLYSKLHNYAVDQGFLRYEETADVGENETGKY